MELYNITANDAINNIAEDVARERGVTKKLARQLVINSLIYNCVINEILGQIDFLLDRNEE